MADTDNYFRIKRDLLARGYIGCHVVTTKAGELVAVCDSYEEANEASYAGCKTLEEADDRWLFCPVDDNPMEVEYLRALDAADAEYASWIAALREGW
ncbi:MAG TPA: hypothetical protein VEA35_06810 [Ramlibacter sp.]|nr:hypothetical protein [Candidatus Limnocylindrales bacterium]HYF42146.1 hypothetical protein [Ramlibacter sp.]